MMTTPTALFLLAAATSVQPVAPAIRCENALRITVFRDGRFLVNEKRSSRDDLDAQIARAGRTRNGEIWFYKADAGNGGPDARAEQGRYQPEDEYTKLGWHITRQAHAHRLPISPTSKPDFSDVVVPGAGRTFARSDCSITGAVP
jgi:hypothetical protein